ncbi:MAG: fatty acid desaturase [Myxococcales bacterium]|nr:fatty acid desaturase [Myxococcales bacterium]
MTAIALDRDAFTAELDALKHTVRSRLGADDLHHRTKIERWGRLCSVLGYATAWIAPNPLSAALISQGIFTRWAMIGHHTSHRGYDRVPGAAPEQTSLRFAKGWRRAVDWLDWIDPEAWHHEHDLLHHYRLGETADPDLVEHNLAWLRTSSLPRPARLAVVAFFMLTWKWSYYAPNTLRAKLDLPHTLLGMFGRHELWIRCLLPVLAIRFALLPLLFAPLGAWAVLSVWLNTVLAELITNVHSFVVIVTNHAGEDLHRFDEPMHDKAEFYRRQVVGSTNFATGGDLNDFLHGWLNYQIEHHLFPDLPMRQYAEIQPVVEQLCAKHGVPYVQESVWVRLRKTIAIAVGDASMIR